MLLSVDIIIATTVGLLIILGILAFFIVRTASMVKRFDKLEIGTSQNDVIQIMGQPSKVHYVDEFQAFTWKRSPLARIIVTRTAYFKDNILISKTTDSSYS